MSRNKKPRRPYRHRPVAINTPELALHHAAKPDRADRAQVLGLLAKSISALCSGVATEFDWSVAAGAVSVCNAIERQGKVRGMQEHLDCANEVLQAIYNRCRHPKMWLRPTLDMGEIDTLRLLLELHTFQVEQLGRAELLAAIDAAEKYNLKQGHVVTLATDLERLAA